MKPAAIIFPHQLFKKHPVIQEHMTVYLVEEWLFFRHYRFHKQKLLFHRASMKCYEEYLREKGCEVKYIEAHDEDADIRKLIKKLIANGITTLHIVNPTDNWLEKRITGLSKEIDMICYNNPLFLNTKTELQSFFKPDKKKFYQTSFYKEQRSLRNILVKNGEPAGGKWTFDTENRKKYPKDKEPPSISFPDATDHYQEAKAYIEKFFPDNPGTIPEMPIYPVNFTQSEQWFEQFLETRFYAFGDYEDALVKKQHFLHHSVLSPLLNTGLLSISSVITKTLDYAEEHDIPINSVEGFIRQLIGWREFIRGIYEVKGSQQRTTNFWKHHRKLPESFYDGSTGIPPIDKTIKKVLKTGYAHHIERLMVLSNFMVLCEFDPDEVYRWFMELFIDAYDWVMVPNVYGMSLFADGGLMSTKPYISSSNYIRKMSDYEGGEWEMVWDGLFWRFMEKHRDFFSKNPRMRMLISNFDKMNTDKKEGLLNRAENFLATL